MKELAYIPIQPKIYIASDGRKFKAKKELDQYNQKLERTKIQHQVRNKQIEISLFSDPYVDLQDLCILKFHDKIEVEQICEYYNIIDEEYQISLSLLDTNKVQVVVLYVMEDVDSCGDSYYIYHLQPVKDFLHNIISSLLRSFNVSEEEIINARDYLIKIMNIALEQNIEAQIDN